MEENEGEWTGNVKITERKKFLVVGVAYELLHDTIVCFYHWRELPQVSFLSRQMFCRDKIMFVATKYFCHDKHVFVAKKKCLSKQNVCDKTCFVVTNMFVATKRLSCQK